MKNKAVYPIFNTLIQEAIASEIPRIWKAGILVLGYICESQGCLEKIKDNFELHVT